MSANNFFREKLASCREKKREISLWLVKIASISEDLRDIFKGHRETEAKESEKGRTRWGREEERNE